MAVFNFAASAFVLVQVTFTCAANAAAPVNSSRPKPQVRITTPSSRINPPLIRSLPRSDPALPFEQQAVSSRAARYCTKGEVQQQGAALLACTLPLLEKHTVCAKVAK